MSNGRSARRGVVKQLSNLSIDEISLVDRGANQHAIISFAKRAPEVDDYFEPVEKDWAEYDQKRGHDGQQGHDLISAPFSQQRKANYRESYRKHPKLAGAFGLPTGMGTGPTAHVVGEQMAGAIGGAVAGGVAGHKLGGETGALIGGATGYLGGAAAGGAHAGKVVHNHFYGKRLEPMDVDALFGDVDKKSSFGRGGNQAVLDEFSGDDPSGVVDDPNGEEGDIGPDGTIDGIETIDGEDMPPKKAKKKSGSLDINPADKAGLGKSAEFWTNVVSKLLDDEEEDVDKHFPGPPGAGGVVGGFQGGMAQQPPQPMMGGQMGQPPMQQSVGAAPMGMGQPMPPQGGGMPAQLPPDVIQYIQQLEQALDQLTGGDNDNSQDGNNNSSNNSNNDDGGKNNPFGKSLEHSQMDEATFLTELSKALDDDNDREVVYKAMESVEKAEQRAIQAEEIAKAERDLRLEREFIAKADDFNLPVASKELGPVLKRLAENNTAEDFQVIVKCLRSATATNDYSPYGEVGKRGGGANGDILSAVDAAVLEEVGKNTDLTTEAATLQVLNGNPAAYDEYLRDQRTRLHN